MGAKKFKKDQKKFWADPYFDQSQKIFYHTDKHEVLNHRPLSNIHIFYQICLTEQLYVKKSSENA